MDPKQGRHASFAVTWNHGPRCCPNLLAQLGFISLPRSPSKIKEGSVLVQPEIAQEVSDCSAREENSNLLVSSEEGQHGAEFFPLTPIKEQQYVKAGYQVAEMKTHS